MRRIAAAARAVLRLDAQAVVGGCQGRRPGHTVTIAGPDTMTWVTAFASGGPRLGL